VPPGVPDPPDPVLRALADYWDDVLELADDAQRGELRALVDGTAEPDPLDARAALADLLLDLLPPAHPVVEVLRTGTMFDPGGGADAAATVADSLAKLRVLVLRQAGPGAPPALDEFDREVRGRLLTLPYLSPEVVRGRDVDPDDRGLIRLTRPDRGVQLPAFQFTEAGAPWPVVRRVNERLGAGADPWGVTCWWVDPHAGLDARPADLLGRGQDALLLRAAAALGVD
jgi:hypothetical protein